MNKIFLLLLFILSSQVMADMGSLSFNPNIKIFEPNQRAIIAWNGTDEILLLSTDLHASENTKVLEVMPLPSEPKVEEGDAGLFKKSIDIINSKRLNRSREYMSANFALSAEEDNVKEVPAAEITFHDNIGAHEIFTVKLIEPGGFIKWVEDYFKKQNIENPPIPDALKAVIKDYINDGYVWFVFDVVSLTENIKTKQALKFSFKTDFMYYPLRITRTETGDTSVDLIILSRELLGEKMMHGIPRKDIKLTHTPVTLTSKELKDLSEEFYVLLEKSDSCKLRIWNIKDKLSDFKQDLLVGYTGVMKSLFKKNPNQLRSITFFATNPDDNAICFMNQSGGVFTYDSTTEKLSFIDKIKVDEPFDTRLIKYSGLGKFKIIFRDETFIDVDFNEKPIR